MTLPFLFPTGEPPRFVLFDMDDTLIEGNSCQHWAHFLQGKGIGTGWRHKLNEQLMLLQYALGRLKLTDYLKKTIPVFGGLPESTRDAYLTEALGSVWPQTVFPEGQQTVKAYKDENIPVAIVTASNDFVANRIAETFFPVDAVIATQLERNPDGTLTGNVVGTPPYREGKIDCVKAWLKPQNLTLKDGLFFTDSHNDLPLAREMGGVVAVNPDKTLKAHAKRQGWPVLHWSV